MPRLSKVGDMVPLLGGAYSARSTIADAERCVNLYPETNPADAELPVTHYPMPGLTAVKTLPAKTWRGLWASSWGTLYGVIDASIVAISADGTCTGFGVVPSFGGPLSILDNTFQLFVCDGGPNVYIFNQDASSAGTIGNSCSTLGYIDGYVVGSIPNTQQFFSTANNESIVPGTFYAAKAGGADYLAGLITVHREIWLIGQRTTEVWGDSGGAAFPFSVVPGVFIERGTCAPGSIAKNDLAVFWLMQDERGNRMVFRGYGYKADRVSTYAVENAMNSYNGVGAAVGFTCQILGHSFYVLNFPADDHTWVYDIESNAWFEWVSIDSDGNEHRSRANCYAFAYDKHWVGDYANGTLYFLDPSNPTDNGIAQPRRRGFMHMVEGGKRVSYRLFRADMEVAKDVPGTSPYFTTQTTSYAPGSLPIIGLAPLTRSPITNPTYIEKYGAPSEAISSGSGSPGYFWLTDPESKRALIMPLGIEQGRSAHPPPTTGISPYGQLSLRWSDDRGRTWSTYLHRNMGATGQTNLSLAFNNLGLARDRVFELLWMGTNAINGAYVRPVLAKS